ncbi:hypothetical protein MSj_03294 [Microcystis aeruginosa Sj]|uniref:Uncharacterized protein n=1 Tax=Microcystis aeruginosa Sj TaxID=1979544 RepID=A0A2Z6UQH7_MICAE|nr:hypothetical protein MSj_03294 [Microcystis aeruginosa Sj]
MKITSQKTLHPSAKATERVQKLRQEYWNKSLDVDNEFSMGLISS